MHAVHGEIPARKEFTVTDPTKSAETERIDRAAAAWVVRRDRGLTAAEQDEFFHWLAADPRHGERLAQHQRTWKEFNLLAQWRPEHSAEPNPDLLAKPRPRRPWRVALGWGVPLAAAAAFAVAVFWEKPAPAPAALATAPRYSQRVLEDGSTVELRGGSEVEVHYTAGERRVVLRHGEAFFTVAKNPARPFIVSAEGVAVRAVGTAFNVRLAAGAVEVLVTEGKVHVAPPPVAGVLAPELPLLEAGRRALVPLADAAAAPPSVATVSAAEIARALAWQPRLLDFNSTPLSEVVAEFNLRNTTQLVLAPDAPASLPIMLTFRSDNVEGFVRLLEANGAIRAERAGDRIALHAAR
ncbi:MAG: hypothetical protein C0502_00730 [Opitutus sp.]|nr:hypothetical protein [Opitutus sp.]